MYPYVEYSNCVGVDERRLDLEFRHILCVIRECISDVGSNHTLTYYRAWIEKLSRTDCQKAIRNAYLFELARQIKTNVLLPPFNSMPPEGSLDNFQFSIYPLKCNVPVEDNYNWSVPDFICDVPNCTCHSPSSQETAQDLSIPPLQSYYFHTYTPLDHPDDFESSNQECVVSQDRNRTTDTDQQDTDYSQKLSVECKDNENEQANNPSEDDSWCDITDSSIKSVANPLGSGDAETKPNLKFDKSLERQSQLKSVYSKNQQPVCQVEKIKPDTQQDFHEIIHYLTNTADVKVADWKKTVDFLHSKLTETQNLNNELKVVSESLKNRIREEIKKREMAEKQQLRLDESRKNDIETLTLFQREHIEKIEKLFKINLEESEKAFNQRMIDIKNNYEQKIAELRTEHEKNVTEKDKQIVQLTTVVEKNCTRLSDEIRALRQQVETYINSCGEDKIFILQKCVSKMDKLFHKSEKEYLKQIEKFKQELELKDKITMIQLRTLKADLIAQCSAEKQKQFNEVVDKLEVKYIKMLEYHENEVMENKKQDDEKLEYLKDLLDRHGIPYDV